jgi:hypothetical protein
MAAAMPRAPTVNVLISGQAMKSAMTAVAGKTASRMRRPPTRSASQPPTGRMAVARTTKPAVRKPAPAGDRSNISVRKVGR